MTIDFSKIMDNDEQEKVDFLNSGFQENCEIIADTLGIEILSITTEYREDYVFEDDGILHVRQNGLRVAFDVSENQTFTAEEQNRISKKILDFLGIKMPKTAYA
jgi:hypothetical protein